MQVARDATEAHGGIGFTWEGDTQMWFKRAMFDRAFLGSPSTHRARAAELGDW
jgi:alkylation response protein AidB-like acyl-CoA dehydrogenase